MFYHPPVFFAGRCIRTLFHLGLVVPLISSLLFPLTSPASAQAYERELRLAAKSTLTIKNRNGRVSVITSDDQKDQALLQATSPGAPVEPGDVTVSGGDISVRERRPQDRIDLTIRVPARTRVKIESESGMVDVIGDLALAEVSTNTGTIHADVPLDAVKFKFLWQASHPRYLSDVELPRVKEGRAGAFSISGTLGANAKKSKNKKKKEPAPDNPADTDGHTSSNEPADSSVDGATNNGAANNDDKPKAEKEQLVQLSLTTQRGVILLNVDPSMAPNDLRERPLTEAAKAIVRTGDGPLM